MLSVINDDYANVAQLVERIHGKDEVPSSILGIGSKGKGPCGPFYMCLFRYLLPCLAFGLLLLLEGRLLRLVR